MIIIRNKPTPVSSMLHAATLVTAGIYLLIRVSPILEYAPWSLVCILWTGAITSLFAASIGLIQNDIKKVIAYSTISQIGYLVLAVGLSQYNTALLHLSGHAYFKALLFLAAGGVIHSIADEQDIRKLGGLIMFLPFTYTAIFIGSLSLIAIFPLSGFYSKDLILELASGTYTFSSFSGYILGTITAGFTAFYSIRLISIVFTGIPQASQHLYKNTHEQPIMVQVPFVILILFSIFYGYISRDIISGLGSDALISSTYNLTSTQGIIIEAEFQPLFLKLIPTIVTIISALLAVSLYNTRSGRIYLVSLKISNLGIQCYTFLHRRWLVDVVYSRFIVNGISIGYIISQIIDRGSLEVAGPFGISRTLYSASEFVTQIDTGLITTYASYMLLSTLSLMFLCLYLFLTLLYFTLLFLVSFLFSSKKTNMKKKKEKTWKINSLLFKPFYHPFIWIIL